MINKEFICNTCDHNFVPVFVVKGADVTRKVKWCSKCGSTRNEKYTDNIKIYTSSVLAPEVSQRVPYARIEKMERQLHEQANLINYYRKMVARLMEVDDEWQ